MQNHRFVTLTEMDYAKFVHEDFMCFVENMEYFGNYKK